MTKVYIEYCTPWDEQDEDQPIEEVYSDGDRPKKKKAIHGHITVLDCNDGKTLINERLWDGVE